MKINVNIEEINVIGDHGVLENGKILITGASGNDIKKLDGNGWHLRGNQLSNSIKKLSTYNIATETGLVSLDWRRLAGINEPRLTFQIHDECEFQEDRDGNYTIIKCAIF